jgi:hypothetical protein
MAGEAIALRGEPLFVRPKRTAADKGDRLAEAAIGPHAVYLAIATVP